MALGDANEQPQITLRQRTLRTKTPTDLFLDLYYTPVMPGRIRSAHTPDTLVASIVPPRVHHPSNLHEDLGFPCKYDLLIHLEEVFPIVFM